MKFSKSTNILITNDDGIKSIGPSLILEIIENHENCTILCPNENKSCASKSMLLPMVPIKISNDVTSSGKNKSVYSCNGTPCDCVTLANHHSVMKKPDLVISGINYGLNVGYTTAISGTFGAAEIATAYGNKGVAISYDVHHYFQNENSLNKMKEDVRKYSKDLFEIIKTFFESENHDVALNINIPKNPKGIAVSHQSKCWAMSDPFLNKENSYTSPNYKILEELSEEGDDYQAIKNSLIAITPIRVGAITCEKSCEHITQYYSKILEKSAKI